MVVPTLRRWPGHRRRLQLRPRRALAGVAPLIVVGITLAGLTSTIPGFMIALALAGVGIGAGQTGATGILLEAVAPERIVTAMVVWSQLGIVGYLAGPALGGAVAQALRFPALGVIPVAAGVTMAIAFHAFHRTSRSSSPGNN